MSGVKTATGRARSTRPRKTATWKWTEAEIEKLRKDQVLTLKDAEQKCLECHDLDNSPAFQEEGAFQRYWEKIKHSKDEEISSIAV